MVCIYCGSKTQVINSRHQKRQNNTWRRRACSRCQAVFTTSEAPELSTSLSVDRQGHLRPFERDKLLFSLHSSLLHRKTASADASALTATIISLLYGQARSGVIATADIRQTAASVLERFDKPAAVHYRAFHSDD